jgi:hypothetical protein
MSRLAAAITIPVTNAARQENSSNSFRILMVIVASPVGDPSDAAPTAHASTVAKR